MSTPEYDKFMHAHKEHTEDHNQMQRRLGQIDNPIRSAMSSIPRDAPGLSTLFTSHKPRPGKTVYKYHPGKKAWIATT